MDSKILFNKIDNWFYNFSPDILNTISKIDKTNYQFY